MFDGCHYPFPIKRKMASEGRNTDVDLLRMMLFGSTSSQELFNHQKNGAISELALRDGGGKANSLIQVGSRDGFCEKRIYLGRKHFTFMENKKGRITAQGTYVSCLTDSCRGKKNHPASRYFFSI